MSCLLRSTYKCPKPRAALGMCVCVTVWSALMGNKANHCISQIYSVQAYLIPRESVQLCRDPAWLLNARAELRGKEGLWQKKGSVIFISVYPI